MNTLKLVLIASFVLFFFSSSFAQKTEKVVSIVREVHEFDWYQTQARLWNVEITKNPKNEDAWLNFYMSNRMARITDYQKWNKKEFPYFLDLEKIVKNASENIPETFTYHYINNYTNGFYSKEGEKSLFKALEISPDNINLFDELLTYYMSKGDKNKIKEISKKWLESNEMPAGILNYNYNMLMSLEKNAIIFSNGDNDTYPVWLLQNAMGIRTDVTLINLSLIYLDDYRKTIFEEIKVPNSLEKNDTAFIQKLISHILTNAKSRPLYFAVTTAPSYYESMKDKFYLVGLALKYSEDDFDNMAMIRKNVEKNFQLDYLNQEFYYNRSSSVVNQMNMSYLAMFVKLYEHYSLSGETEKAQQIKQYAQKICDKAGSSETMEWFKSE